MLAIKIFAAGIFCLIIITLITEFVFPAIWQPAIIIENLTRTAMPDAYQASAMTGLTENDLLGNLRAIPIGFAVVSFACIIAYMYEEKQKEEEYHEIKADDVPRFTG